LPQPETNGVFFRMANGQVSLTDRVLHQQPIQS
jgi:hypothetical protein